MGAIRAPSEELSRKVNLCGADSPPPQTSPSKLFCSCVLCRLRPVSVYVGVFGKKLRADRRHLSTNVNLFELGGVREEEERALWRRGEETLNFCLSAKEKYLIPSV